MKILACNDVSVKYESTLALKNCSFELEAGNFLGVFGENGTGKTTLLKSIAGLIKPSSGTMDFHGIKKREIGYMAQQTLIQKNFPASVYEAIISGTLCKHKKSFFYSKNDKSAFPPPHSKAHLQQPNHLCILIVFIVLQKSETAFRIK